VNNCKNSKTLFFGNLAGCFTHIKMGNHDMPIKSLKKISWVALKEIKWVVLMGKRLRLVKIKFPSRQCRKQEKMGIIIYNSNRRGR
jgi:calcineurin-like phosphoesterase family protein